MSFISYEKVIGNRWFVPAILCMSVIPLLQSTLFAQNLFVKALGEGGTDVSTSVIMTSSGSIVTTGYTWSFGAGSHDILLCKFDISGDPIWVKTFGGSYADDGYSVIETSDSGFVVLGQTSSFGSGSTDLLLSKFDSLGNHLWSRTLGADQPDYGRSVIKSSDGGFVVVGWTENFSIAYTDLLISRFDSLGNHLWTRVVGGLDWDYGYSVIQTSDGNLVVVGVTYSYGAGSADVFLCKFDLLGNLIWSRTLGGGGNDYGYSIAAANDGGFVVAGVTSSF
ncbi:MAG: hypothetical protein DRJ64_10570, partial [Thermoprotei archaeon]